MWYDVHMSEWIRFEDGRARNNMEYGSIMKDGRLVISNDIAVASGVVPGVWVEIYYKPSDKVIGIKPVPTQTPFSKRVISTGPKDHPFDEPIVNRRTGKRQSGKPNAVVALGSFLNSRHIGLSSKVRGHLFIDVQSGMLCFEFPDAPAVITPSVHAGDQMTKKAFVDRVAGDVG